MKMFNAIKCPSCGEENKKNSKFCSGCGKMLAGQICGACGESLQRGAIFCSSCGAKVQTTGSSTTAIYQDYQDMSDTNVWQRRPNDFAHRFEMRDLNSFLGLVKKLTVMQGTKAIFMQGGVYRSELLPGVYDVGGLREFFKTFDTFQKSTVILVDDGDTPIDFTVQNLRTAESFDAAVKGKMIVKIENPRFLLENFMKGKEHLGVNDLETLMRNELLNVLQNKIKQYSFEDLYGNLSLKKEIEREVQNNLGITLNRVGLHLVHLPYFDYDESYWNNIIRQRGALSRELIEKREKIRKEADIGLEPYRQQIATKGITLTIRDEEIRVDKELERQERRRLDEITKLFRERLTDDKINEIKNGEDLAKYLNTIDKDRLIRQNEIEELKVLFDNNRQDKEYARKLMLDRLQQRHTLEMEGERLDEGIKGKTLVDQYEIGKRRKEFDQDKAEAEAGIDLLGQMKGVKQKDFAGYQALEIEKRRKIAEIDGATLKDRSNASYEALISMTDGEQAKHISELARMKFARELTPQQITALTAKDSDAVAKALQDMYGGQQAKELYELRMKDYDGFLQRMQQMSDRAMDRMGDVAITRATPESQGTTVVSGGGFGTAPVIVDHGISQVPQSPARPNKNSVVCKKCNSVLESTEKFCNKCGEKVQ